MTLPTLTIAHWNVGGRPFDQVVKRVTYLLNHADALTLNEVGDQKKALHAVCADLGTVLLQGAPGESGSSREAIIYRPDRLLPTGPHIVRRVLPLSKGDPRAAGYHSRNGNFGPKYISAQEFEDRATPNRTPILATEHIVPSVRFPIMEKLAKRSLDETRQWVVSTHGGLVFNGDWNMKYDHPLTGYLRQAGLVSNHDTLGPLPTFGRRTIDASWARGLVALSQERVNEKRDHAALIVAYDYLAKR